VRDKFGKMITVLQKEEALHIFDGSQKGANRKIDLSCSLQGVAL